MKLDGLHHITMITRDAPATLRLPEMHEHLRERLERTLTALTNPRRARETA